jgi:RimJ/RimL family protein N-acetyltransferase
MESDRMEFHPPDAVVPAELRTERLLLRPLRVTDVERDYQAVMSSAAMLRIWSQTDWPADDFSLAENRDDLERHEREHRERKAFTFTVLDPGATRCLGCVYLTPLDPDRAALCEGASCAANAGFWVRAAEIENELDRHLLEALREWLGSEWSFDRVLFTISARDERQAELLAAARLALLKTIEISPGRIRSVYG